MKIFEMVSNVAIVEKKRSYVQRVTWVSFQVKLTLILMNHELNGMLQF